MSAALQSPHLFTCGRSQELRAPSASAAMCHTISHKYLAHLRTRKYYKPTLQISALDTGSLGHMWWVSRCHAVLRHAVMWPQVPSLWWQQCRADCHNSLPLSLNLENDLFDPAPDSVGLRHLWRDVVEPFTAFVAYRCQLLMEWVRAESAHHLGWAAKYNLYSVNHADYSSYSSSTFQLFPAENVPNYQNFADESKYPRK